MKIDLAVYTAIEGYDWQPETSYSRNDLRRWKERIGRFPDPLMEELPFGGVFNDGNWVVFYRFHLASKYDSKNRDSLYLVLGAVDKGRVGEIDFKLLFSLPELAKPMKPAPSAVNCVAFPARKSNVDFSASFQRNERGVEFFSSIGSIFSQMTEGELMARITGSMENPAFALSYTRPVAKQAELPSVTGGFEPKASPLPSWTAPQRPMPVAPQANNGHVCIDKVMLSVLLGVAFLLGVITGYYVHNVKDWIAKHVHISITNETHPKPPPPNPIDAGIGTNQPPHQWTNPCPNSNPEVPPMEKIPDIMGNDPLPPSTKGRHGVHDGVNETPTKSLPKRDMPRRDKFYDGNTPFNIENREDNQAAAFLGTTTNGVVK